GEGIISYKIQKFNKGWNDVELNITNEYFPNFKVAVSAMNIESANIAPKLVIAEKEFTVERQLSIAINIKDSYLPGEEVFAEVIVTDQVGKPASAELSLALVEEALFALYPDTMTPITDFFSEGTHREAGMKTLSSCTFRYEPPTRKVLKELLEEAERLAIEEQEADRRKQIIPEVSDKLALDATFAKPSTAGTARMRVAAKAMEKEGAGLAYAEESKKEMLAPSVAGRGMTAAPEPRKEFPEAGGYWIPVIITDSTGKAKAKIIMPDKITQWRITSRGCTVDTVVGQATLNTITKKPFFVEVKLPTIVTEGDVIRVPVRVHNLSDYEGNASLTLKLTIDERTITDQKQVNIKKNDTLEIVFNGMTILAGRTAQFEVSAKAGNMTDAVVRTLPIRPWGVEYADNKGGVSSGNESIFLQLPDDQKYTSKQMTITISPSVNRLVFDMAMGYMLYRDINFASKIIPTPGDMGNDLLAIVYAIDYLKKIGGNVLDSKMLMDRARSLISSIVSTQNSDGGWTWIGITKGVESDIFTTSRTFWALAIAQKQGITVNPQTMERAIAYLKSAFAKVDQNDDDAKSIILHALSTVNEADFAYANRLYRNRNEMKPITLAYTALTFVNLDRNEIESEILAILLTKKLDTLDVETASLGLLAIESIMPDSPMIKQYVDYIISKHSCYGFSPYRAKGPAVASIATYYGRTQFAKSDYRLTVSVNGTKVKEIDVKKEQPSHIIPVQTKLIVDSKNRVDFNMEGRGNYSYTITLSGFSPDIKDPKSWDKPSVESRRYYHAPLEYKGRQMAYSTTEITQLPDGERTNVSVSISETYSNKYLIVTEYIPAGTTLVDKSVAGNYQHYIVGDGIITFYYMPGRNVRSFNYQLVSYVPGSYRILPTIIRDAINIDQMRIGETDSLEVLAGGEKSKDEYKMNDSELYEFGKAYFDDGNYADSLSMLSKLYERNRTYNQREVARMLLWIYTEDKYYNAKKVVEFFEILKERFPELYIPFNRIIAVGKAYREIGEYERAYLVYKATIDASFINDSNVSAVLQDEGQFLNSIDFQENMWQEYPDTPQVVSSYFAISQALYSKVPQADQLAKEERKLKILGDKAVYKGKDRKITKPDLLKEIILMLSEFLMLYPNDPLADDAVFSMANALLDLEDY
ncbi:MAG: alpha-2-macroglobulin family protein, partial [Candidatus Poribacteria bacterium]